MADPLGESLLLQLFGIKNPALRILDFFLDNPGSDFSKTEIAAGAEISRSTLFAIWPKLQSLELVIMTREIGHARMFRLNKKSPIVKKLVELDDAISAFYASKIIESDMEKQTHANLANQSRIEEPHAPGEEMIVG